MVIVVLLLVAIIVLVGVVYYRLKDRTEKTSESFVVGSREDGAAAAFNNPLYGDVGRSNVSNANDDAPPAGSGNHRDGMCVIHWCPSTHIDTDRGGEGDVTLPLVERLLVCV
jgi:hypothetical protein